MAKSKRTSVQKYHDRVAARYDDSYDDTFWQWHDALTWDYLKPHLPRDMSAEVIDLGCGTGKWAAKIIKSGYRVTCVDISPKMLDQAQRKIDGTDGSSRASFIRADLCDLSAIDSGKFELAIALGDPICCCDTPRKAMREIHRILSDAGLLVASFDNKLAAIDYYLERGDPQDLSRFLRDGKTHWLTRDVDEQFPISTFSPNEVAQLADRCGFEVLELIAKTVLPMRHYRQLLETPESRRAWAKMEKKLSRDTNAVGRASHIQMTARARSR